LFKLETKLERYHRYVKIFLFILVEHFANTLETEALTADILESP